MTFMILTSEKSSEVAERIRADVEAALASRRVSARRASMDVVGHDGLIRDIRAGRIPSADRIEALFNYLGLEAYFGPKRSDAPFLSGPLIANIDPGNDAPGGFLTIPWAESGVKRGSAPIAFSRSWLALHNLVPDFLQAAQPDVVAVEGPVSDETLALVDTRQVLRKGYDVWCYRDGDHVIVSHLTFKGGITVVHPARSQDAPRIIEGPLGGVLSILGKVVWLGQSIPFKGAVG